MLTWVRPSGAQPSSSRVAPQRLDHLQRGALVRQFWRQPGPGAARLEAHDADSVCHHVVELARDPAALLGHGCGRGGCRALTVVADLSTDVPRGSDEQRRDHEVVGPVVSRVGEPGPDQEAAEKQAGSSPRSWPGGGLGQGVRHHQPTESQLKRGLVFLPDPADRDHGPGEHGGTCERPAPLTGNGHDHDHDEGSERHLGTGDAGLEEQVAPRSRSGPARRAPGRPARESRPPAQQQRRDPRWSSAWKDGTGPAVDPDRPSG